MFIVISDITPPATITATTNSSDAYPPLFGEGAPRNNRPFSIRSLSSIIDVSSKRAADRENKAAVNAS